MESNRHNRNPINPDKKYHQSEQNSRNVESACPVSIATGTQPCHLIREFLTQYSIEETRFALHECLVGFIGSEYSTEMMGTERVNIALTMQALAAALKQFDDLFHALDNKQS